MLQPIIRCKIFKGYNMIDFNSWEFIGALLYIVISMGVATYYQWLQDKPFLEKGKRVVRSFNTNATASLFGVIRLPILGDVPRALIVHEITHIRECHVYFIMMIDVIAYVIMTYALLALDPLVFLIGLGVSRLNGLFELRADYVAIKKCGFKSIDGYIRYINTELSDFKKKRSEGKAGERIMLWMVTIFSYHPPLAFRRYFLETIFKD